MPRILEVFAFDEYVILFFSAQVSSPCGPVCFGIGVTMVLLQGFKIVYAKHLLLHLQS